MKAVIGITLAAIASAGDVDINVDIAPLKPKDIFPGSYEFEIMGVPMRLYYVKMMMINQHIGQQSI